MSRSVATRGQPNGRHQLAGPERWHETSAGAGAPNLYTGDEEGRECARSCATAGRQWPTVASRRRQRLVPVFLRRNV